MQSSHHWWWLQRLYAGGATTEARSFHFCTAGVPLRGGQSITADNVVVALGNFPAGSHRLSGMSSVGASFISHAWTFNALELQEISNKESVLLIGSGLTAVDIAIALRAHEFTGTIHILSRHGLLPYRDPDVNPVCADQHQGTPQRPHGNAV